MLRFGLDTRAVAIGILAVALALGLGAAAGSLVSVWAGALAALASLVSSAVLTTAVMRQQRTLERMKKQREIRRKYALPKSIGDREGDE